MGFNTHLWGFQGDRLENIHFLCRLCQKNKPCSEGFNTHLWCFQGDRWENIHFESKPMACEPLTFNCLRKTSPVLRVSSHIYGVFKEIDGKTFIFESKSSHVTPKSIISEN